MTDGQQHQTCYYPKHEGADWSDIIRLDPEYVLWIVGGEGPEDLDPELEDYLIELLENQ